MIFSIDSVTTILFSFHRQILGIKLDVPGDTITTKENCYFIKISEECYHHWKNAKEDMNFKEDEDLIYHLMNLKRRTLSVALE